MISKKQVINIANLARIKIDKKEAGEFQKEFSNILNYFDTLKKVKVFKIKENNFQETKLRKDEIKKFPGNVLESAPNKKGNYIKVKKIF